MSLGRYRPRFPRVLIGVKFERKLNMQTFYAELEFTTIGEIEIMANSIDEARQLLLNMRLDTQDMDFVQDGWNPQIVSLEEGV